MISSITNAYPLAVAASGSAAALFTLRQAGEARHPVDRLFWFASSAINATFAYGGMQVLASRSAAPGAAANNDEASSPTGPDLQVLP